MCHQGGISVPKGYHKDDLCATRVNLFSTMVNICATRVNLCASRVKPVRHQGEPLH
jgi:hypothetical protein